MTICDDCDRHMPTGEMMYVWWPSDPDSRRKVCDRCDAVRHAGQRRLDAEDAAEIRADNRYWSERARAGLTYPCD